MKYDLFYTKKAVDDIKKLDSLTRKRIGKKLLGYSNHLFEHAIKLTDSKIGGYRFRIGDYRAVFDIKGNKIIVLKVRHRKDIYKK
ncbi:MAG: type II toxin-antitoxin system RelE/ParE family toxin [Patescibacteria group bacterium]|nr:type II toxin-antitoxin system RelE/ParE family toxin [Patescibacteria group bacterium]